MRALRVVVAVALELLAPYAALFHRGTMPPPVLRFDARSRAPSRWLRKQLQSARAAVWAQEARRAARALEEVSPVSSATIGAQSKRARV